MPSNLDVARFSAYSVSCTLEHECSPALGDGEMKRGYAEGIWIVDSTWSGDNSLAVDGRS